MTPRTQGRKLHGCKKITEPGAVLCLLLLRNGSDKCVATNVKWIAIQVA